MSYNGFTVFYFFKVKWANFGLEYAQWEPLSNLDSAHEMIRMYFTLIDRQQISWGNCFNRYVRFLIFLFFYRKRRGIANPSGKNDASMGKIYEPLRLKNLPH